MDGCKPLMQGDKKIVMPDGYNEAFQRAFWTFRHARVYDPKLRWGMPHNARPRHVIQHNVKPRFLEVNGL